MKWFAKCLLFLCVTCATPAAAQVAASLTIVGTLHQPSRNLNADTLYNLLVKLKPDVFLLEIDSVGRLSRLAPEDAQRNENQAIVRYKRLRPALPIEPFDMVDMSSYFKRHQYWENMGRYNRGLDSLVRHQALDSVSQTVFEAFIDITTTTRYFESEHATLRVINSVEATKAIELRNKWEYERLRLLTIRNPKLHHLACYSDLARDYWNVRNKAMASNILRIVKKYPGKQLVVFVGNNHRYYLLNELTSKQKALNFKLTVL